MNIKQAMEHLKIKRRRFFVLLKKFRSNPEKFTIRYNKKDTIEKKHDLKISLNTIIKRAREHNFYIIKKTKKKHDREVLTNYPGELIQHDSSYHLFAPNADCKWYLITSLADFSRMVLYAAFVEKETSWTHIFALENIFLKYGIPLSYYVDSHSIFRFIQGRDSNWRNHKKLTDDVNTQWKQVLLDFNVNVSYALSPQAKGKIERPYQWLQDRIVRTCAKNNVKNIKDGREILKYEFDRYNNHQVHSTTKEIPIVRFERAISQNNSLFRPFKYPNPYFSNKDLFCLRVSRIVDGYHNISFNNLTFFLKSSGS